MSWNDLGRHPGLPENVSVTECHGKSKAAGKDFGHRLGALAHFADGKTEAQRQKGPHLMKLTWTGIGRCRFNIWVSGLPVQAASLG